MRGRYRWWLAAVLGAGLAVRLVVAWWAAPTGDLAAFLNAVHALQRWGLHFYAHANAYDPASPFTYRNYSYPPAYLPWLWFSNAAGSGATFWRLARIPPVLADIALSWIVQWELGKRGAGEGLRLVAAASIVAAPTFFVSSAVEGQIDGVAILPAVIAAIVWERGDPQRRATWAGLLIGAGAAVKTAPFLMVLALLPTAVSRREVVRLVGWAVALPLGLLAPFLLADPGGTLSTLRYGGFPGAGGIGLLVQPGLGRHYLGDYDLSSALDLLQRLGWLFTAAGAAVATLANVRTRRAAVPAAALLWLGVYATSVNWYPQYLAWGVPFFLMAGWVWPVVAADLVLLPTIVIAYRDRLPGWLVPAGDAAVPLYVVAMDAVWLAAAASFVVVAGRALTGGRDVTTTAPG
jgi:hypothetical protein